MHIAEDGQDASRIWHIVKDRKKSLSDHSSLVGCMEADLVKAGLAHFMVAVFDAEEKLLGMVRSKVSGRKKKRIRIIPSVLLSCEPDGDLGLTRGFFCPSVGHRAIGAAFLAILRA
jgi:hypothetical protein